MAKPKYHLPNDHIGNVFWHLMFSQRFLALEMGDIFSFAIHSASTFGAMEHFTLPETGFTVGFPKALIVRPNGDAIPGGVSPDIKISRQGSNEGKGEYGITQCHSHHNDSIK